VYSRDKFIFVVNVMLDDFMYILKKCYSVVKQYMDELWGGLDPLDPPLIYATVIMYNFNFLNSFIPYKTLFICSSLTYVIQIFGFCLQILFLGLLFCDWRSPLTHVLLVLVLDVGCSMFKSCFKL
jgi:hypothetical protein